MVQPSRPLQLRGSHESADHPPPAGEARDRRRAHVPADRRGRRTDQQPPTGARAGRGPGASRPYPDPRGPQDRREIPQHRRGGAGRPLPGGLRGAGEGRRRLRPRPRTPVPGLRGADDHRGAEAPLQGPDRARATAPFRAGDQAAGAARAAGPRTGRGRPPAHARGDRPGLRSVRGRGGRGRPLPGRGTAPLARRAVGGTGRGSARVRRGARRTGRPDRDRRRTRGTGRRAEAVPGAGAPHPGAAVLPRPDTAADRRLGGHLADACVPADRPVPGRAARDARASRSAAPRRGRPQPCPRPGA